MKSVLVTGGTGSFGQAFVRRLLEGDTERIVVYSRGEHRQEEMRRTLDPEQERLRFAIGDVRDERRLRMACRGVDTIVHAAALKVVPLIESNPLEAVKTNVLGAANVIECAITEGVESVVALGSDKQAAPRNAYGATKLCAEKLFQAAWIYGGRSTRFVCTRYGNVTGSAGSVVPLWREYIARGELVPVTDAGMTRFWMTLDEAVGLVLLALATGQPGEVFVPELPAYRVGDLATALGAAGYTVTGPRPGEKMHEVMISADELDQAWRVERGYRLRPYGADGDGIPQTTPVASNTAMRLTVEEIRQRLAELEGSWN